MASWQQLVDHARMELTPGERISLIRESATLLDKQEWSEIDLVLEQHGLPTAEFDVPDTKSAYIKNMIKNASDESLIKLHEYLIGETASSPVRHSPWSGKRLRLFCSHLAQHKQIVGQVGECLAIYGVEPFVAHDSIEPSKEWVSVIEAALTDCDAMIVFLHSGFHESCWCDQEVGWAFGRKRPILPLNYGVNPYGFIGKLQAQPCAQASTVARHDHGTTLSGFLPGAWDHLVASDGTTRRVAPWGLIISDIRFLHVVRRGGSSGVPGGLGDGGA